MARYYLDVPKTTFDMLQPHQLDENGEVVLNKDGSPRKNRKYNPELIKKLGRLSRIQSLDYKTLSPKRLDGSSAIVEVDFDGAQYSLDDFDEEELRHVTNKTGELDSEKVETYKLDKYVEAGILLGYGHWPHRGDGKGKCIHCYLREHHNEFFEPEPGE